MALILLLISISTVAARQSSCPADDQPRMRPPSLLQTATPRRLSSGPVGEAVESEVKVSQQAEQHAEAGEARGMSAAASKAEQVLAEAPEKPAAYIASVSSLTSHWKPFAAAWAGDFSDPNQFLVPCAVITSIVCSCFLVACMLASYKPQRRKMDHQFEPVRLGLPADYGLSPKMRANAC
mmetsp:Transcript_9425/g.16721  ORF Transcript_9425/g.16721 Transcript_9425/m.16721 type:complete len:180 (+) Transcript_9425:164-703(+)|eukprot:CAMPEP_0197652660 /NCGR_PEP_ID=MMETSP1338-20131121/34585_1 /TAXON_ID=43686 ORGANISM="Pelagodinium beii, Strain RCC1491" /NCGR_SAMPLE_ID=MMETSP1338 /ASSEMBLY_ACC=CAM_ASM_000754 /LENGTH=179 /DNA_ID=CAMNT_0043227583 /DNA_START=158 /DNA_END=697 /DNA_ORIENTATION=+